MAGGNAIAAGSVLITADADKLHGGLSSAGRDVDKWGRDQGGKAGKGFAGSFGGMVKGGIAGALAIGVGDMVFGAFMDLDEKAGHFEDMADNLGMSIESLMEISHAADITGVDIATLEAGLQRLRLTSEGPLDDAMMQFASRLEGIQDPGERANLLFDTFGKSGVKMGTLFAQGAEGLQKLRQEATDLGLTMSKTQAGQIGAAADAINNAKKAARGLLAQFLTSFAPIMESVVGFATKFMSAAKPVIDWYMRAWGQIGDIATAVWEQIRFGVQLAGEWIDGVFGSMFDWTGELPTVQEVIVAVFRNVGIAASYVWDTIKAGAGVVAWVAGQIVSGFGKVVEVFKLVAGLAMKLPKDIRPPFVDKLVAGIGEFEGRVKRTGAELIAWGKGAWSGFGGTAKVFNEWLDKALVKAKAVKDEGVKAVKGAAEVKAKDELKFAGAVVRGSADAFSIVLKNQFRDLMGAGGKKELEELKKIRKADEKAAEKLKEIGKKLEDIEKE